MPDTLYLEDVRDHPEYHTIPGLMIFRIDEELFFANVALVVEEIIELAAVACGQGTQVLTVGGRMQFTLTYGAVEIKDETVEQVRMAATDILCKR